MQGLDFSRSPCVGIINFVCMALGVQSASTAVLCLVLRMSPWVSSELAPARTVQMKSCLVDPFTIPRGWLRGFISAVSQGKVRSTGVPKVRVMYHNK